MAKRRTVLAGLGLLLGSPGVLFARVPTETRFVFVILRGAADGLNTVVPYGDPRYAAVRGALAINAEKSLKLNGTFALHPGLAHLASLYAAKEALFVHAVATPYRERSHFDAQNVLESGGAKPLQLPDGWLNRLVALLDPNGPPAIAFTPTLPFALRGPGAVTSYAPSALPPPSGDLLSRVQQLYAADRQLQGLWSAATSAVSMPGAPAGAYRQQAWEGLGRLAAGMLAKPAGPRIAMLELGGWDTHYNQAPRLTTQLRALDVLMGSLKEGLGTAWPRTVVLVATEFGRAVLPNGSGGTDHGTGSVAIIAGGAVNGGQVLADWPGLSATALHEGRDLRPTLDLHALINRAVSEAFGLDPERAAKTLFPHVAGARELPSGLLRL